ncbi:MAG: hypothetical protein AAF378_16265 [Cyanobacteria bacterium P01_A01_bin.84]
MHQNSPNNIILTQEQIESLGYSLREIEQGILKPGQRKGAHRLWFQGAEPYFDIFIETIDSKIVWFQFTLRGKSLSWDIRRPGWQTGNTDELKIDDVSFYAASKTIDSDSEVDWNFVTLTKSILETRIQEDIFAKILKLYS